MISQGHFDKADQLLRTFLSEAPNHADALYMSAVCARYMRRFDDAVQFLDKLQKILPDFGRGLQERGHLFREQGESEKALNAYVRATQANPALEASWRAQSEIFAKLGRHGEAQNASRQVEHLQGLPRELIGVTNFVHEGKLLKAENLCRFFLQRNPRHVEGMRLLADIGIRLGVLDEADFLLESAIEFEPENIQLRLDYIQLLRKRQKFEAALAQARSLYDRDKNNPVFISQYAIENLQTGNIEEAIDLFDRVLEVLPNDPATLTSRGHALKTWGQQEKAISSYRLAYRAKPDHGDAFYGLANLKTYSFTDEEIALMQDAEASDQTAFRDRIHLYFALGKAFEDRKEYEASFSYYARGNELKRINSTYSADTMAEELENQKKVCTTALFSKFEDAGHSAPDPIFIVGLPRAGSTLLEQILASHSQVDGTLELPNILSLSQSLRGRNHNSGTYPEILGELTPERLKEMGEEYIEGTRIHRQNAPYFVDKMPNNFRHIGLIHLILPNAKIIDARREPMACCFSGFKQLFAEGQEFTYGLEQIGQYYRGYVELMRHWDSVLPGKILRVHHEDVVDDLEGQVRRILDYCDLPFEQNCLEYYATERSVRTASSEQVRRPIQRSGLAQWKNFEPYLGPLKEALGPVLTEYRA
ncbi:sulfotransferase [Hyphococcus sp. DH-69]|uniref:sulfotransferase n=1 Tax=Hyphococcus formosus TaxID=3143534 RepID=UPI00398AF656